MPHRVGRYTLKIDLVDQHICWFEAVGSKPLVVEFEGCTSMKMSSGIRSLRDPEQVRKGGLPRSWIWTFSNSQLSLFRSKSGGKPPLPTCSIFCLFQYSAASDVPHRHNRVTRLKPLAVVIVVATFRDAFDCEAKHLEDFLVNTF